MLSNMPELLSPAGSMESLYAAVNNGCDAVYLGGKSFSARQYAGNFSLTELENACDYCHLRGVRVYVTVNTLYKEKEIEDLLQYISKLYEMGVDALILQDVGAMSLIKEKFPDFPLHASTQLTANSLDDVNRLYQEGFSKIVLSRELSLEEIKYIAEGTEAEIETFVHGALCVCYSGQCIMSSMLGGRSGNRGRCAQTCRLPYSLYREYDKILEAHLLSPKDIQTVTILPELIKAGISSLKIEGRMKKPEYVAGVTKIYRKYLDLYAKDPDNYEVDKKDLKTLMQLFNRGGFTEGYYESFAGSEMMCIDRPKTWGLKTGFVDSYNSKLGRVTIRTREPLVPGDGVEIWTQKEPHVGSNISRASKAGEVISFLLDGDIAKNDVVYKTHDKKLSDELKKTWEKDTRQQPIYGYLKAKIGQPLALQLWDNQGSSIFVTGDVVQQAEQQPLAVEKLEQQVKKTGSTPFFIEKLDLEADKNIYVGIRSINELRRNAVEELENSIVKKTKRNFDTLLEKKEVAAHLIQKQKNINVLVTTKAQFDSVMEFNNVKILYFELNESFENCLENCIQKCHDKGIQIYAALPRVDRLHTKKVYADFIQRIKQSDIDGFLVRTIGQFSEYLKSGKKIAVDYTLNVYNNASVAYWQNEGAQSVCISPELNLQEINQVANKDCEMLVYGYLPLMITQQCPVGNFVGGKTSGKYCSEKGNEDLYYLEDRKGMKFPLLTNCKECNCTILNGKPLFTLKFYDEIIESTTGSVRIYFTKEGPKRTKRIMKAYSEMTKDWHKQSVETKILIQEMSEKGSTKGHYFRGVE